METAAKDEATKRLNFILETLPKLILERNEEFKSCQLVKCSAEACSQLDGFMSAIYKAELTLKNSNEVLSTHQMIVKIMKGDKNFRDTTKSSVLSSNEIYIYKHVIPYYQKFVTDSGASFKPDWVPKVYFADYSIFPELSDQMETILALENLTPSGYRLGPRIDLAEDHLRMMIKLIANYHAVSYAMRIQKDPMLETLADGLVPSSFVGKDGTELESYKIHISIAIERLFAIIEKDPKVQEKTDFLEVMSKFRTKYGERPMELMQKFLETDEVFSLILHGDYNRNNVLFQYKSPEGFADPTDVKMFDFQEVRYATPAIDLAFFMYGNLHPSLRPTVWDSLLELYHETLVASLAEMLKCGRNDDRLKPYSFEKFIDHFEHHAMYGVLIGIHYIQWMACPEDECGKMSKAFEASDILELSRIARTCGGTELSDRMISVVLHAFEKGYLSHF